MTEPTYRMTISRQILNDSKHVELTVESTLARDEGVHVAMEDWPSIYRDQVAWLATLAHTMGPWIAYERQEHHCRGRAIWRPCQRGRWSADGVWSENLDPVKPDEWDAYPHRTDGDDEECSVTFIDYDGLPAVYFYVPRNRERDWCTRINAALIGIRRTLDRR